ncbi:MAG TPA: hypothetical protein VEO54_25130 [Thermoanaerobaculia bacterium]|nr:hypothetical protein [Thermoanaerobaculia bacterium]
MLEQTIVWTTLPHGSGGPNVAGTKLRLSVHIAPRLWNDDPTVTKMKLGSFPDFLDWPATVAAATYGVSFNGGAQLPATVVATKPLRGDVWSALFNADTSVIPYRFENLTGVDLLSFPAVVLHDTIRDLYADIGIKHGKELPPREVLATDATLVDIAEEIPPPKDYVPVPVDDTPKFVGSPTPEPEPPVPAKPAEKGCCGCGCLALPLALARRFLKWLGFVAMLPFVMSGVGGGVPRSFSAKRNAVDQLHHYIKASETSEPLPTDFEETYDFHQMVSTLGDYPNLLRYTGLVVDLEVTLDAPLPANGTVAVTPTLPLAINTTTNYAPRTHYVLGDGKFEAEPGPASDLRNGLLRVDDETRFRVLQLDVAGSALKLRAAANKLVNEHAFGTASALEPKQQGLPALQTAGLSIVRPKLAEQLKALFFTSWALNARLAAVDGSPVTPAEGANPAPKDDLFAEDLVRGYRVDVWDDQSTRWHSLCRRVGTYDFTEAGLVLDDERDEGFVQMSVTEPAKEEVPRRLRLHESLFTWNGWSLGAPRYGKTILSPKTPPPNTPPDPDDPTQVGEPRNDAVTPFMLETRFRPEPKSLPRLRFGYGYRMRVRAADLAGNSVFAPEDAEFTNMQAEVTPEVQYRRFEPVAPPMVMLQAKPVEGESLERLVVRSQFDDAPALITAQQSVRHLVPPKTSQLMAEYHRKFDTIGPIDASPAAYQLVGSEAGSLMERVHPVTGDREPLPGAVELSEGPHTYWLQTNDTFDLPYLPDPYARGVMIAGLPGTPELRIPLAGPWPSLKPIRLRVTGIPAGAVPAAPAFNAAELVLTVEVPQGETVEVQLRSFFKHADLENMAVWKWTADKGDPQTPVLRAEAIAGNNWLHLPSRTLVLVHAVQQPLAIPSMNVTTAAKSLGDTVATLSGTFSVDAKSTGKVDVDASWEDPFDDPSKPAFVAATDVVRSEARLAEVRLLDPKDDTPAFANLKHALGDTKYHEVAYTPVGATRFREYFPPTLLPQDLIRPAETEAGVPEIVDILNSARPLAPKPQYIVPLFQWERTSGGGTMTAVRRGGGLRVYLDRPWFSSGKGELLGVTLKPAAVPFGSDEAEQLKKYTSEWGMDPLWPASATFPLFEATFLDAAVPPRTVRLAELDRDVTVVGYEPQYDAERNLWFCDIRLEPGTSYFPFVRLALVRFQPKSVPKAEISPVVLADFIQLVPHRDVQYDVASVDTTGDVKVEVSGPTYAFNDAPSGTSRMLVRLERRAAGGSDELGWEPIASQFMTPTGITAAKTTWRTTINTPLPRPTPLRVVVLEIESYAADGPSLDPLGVLEGVQLPDQNVRGATTLPVGHRVTFADAIEV